MLTQAQVASSALLVIAVLVGAYSDWRWRRLPNWLTLGTALAGLALGLAGRGLDGGKDSLIGWLLGIALLFLPFALGGMGAGDVKLMGAVGALRGPSFVFISFIYTALIGGVVSLVLMAYQGRLCPLLKSVLGWLWLALRCVFLYRSLPPLGSSQLLAPAGEEGVAGKPKLTSIPYGLAIAAGSLLALALGH